jgi:hypothetical protein
LIFLYSDLGFIVRNQARKLGVSNVFLIDSPLDVRIFCPVSLIKGPQVVKFFLIGYLLVLELMKFCFSINKSRFLVLKGECFVVKNSVEVINAAQSF